MGNYTIDTLIGEGTFGKVYHGYHTILGRETAIKVIKISTKCEAQKRLDNFIREARVLAKVDDPRVVKIYDVFLSEEGPCIAMEFVRGENLHDYYQMFDRSYSEIAMLFGQAVQGLNTLHRCNIVHRDLKPANFLVNFSPIELKITDFGLDYADEPGLQTTYCAITGTLPYMSPEQIDGEELDCRSDIWAMGVILYELITGELPFELAPIMKNRKSLHSDTQIADNDCPKWARELVEGMLQVNREKRYESCQDILKRLPINIELDTETMLDAVVRMLPDKGLPVNREELIRTAARDLGVNRVGKNIRHQFLNAITRGVYRGLVTRIERDTICRK